jgi:hypothetical protein
MVDIFPMPMAKNKLKTLGFVNSLTNVFKMDFNKDFEKEEFSEERKPSTKRARTEDAEDDVVDKKTATAKVSSSKKPCIESKPVEPVRENFKTVTSFKRFQV